MKWGSCEDKKQGASSVSADWSDDTDQMALIMMSLIDTECVPNVTDFAKKFSVWATVGFEDLGDTKPTTFNAMTSAVVKMDNYMDDPLKCANIDIRTSGKKMALNGSLQRNSIIGVVPECEHNAELFSLCTHADPRCSASCVIHALIISCLVYTRVDAPDSVDKLFQHCVEIVRPSLDTVYSAELSAVCQTAYTSVIGALNLDDPGKMSYVFKTLSCAIYMLQVIKTSLRIESVPSSKNACN